MEARRRERKAARSSDDRAALAAPPDPAPPTEGEIAALREHLSRPLPEIPVKYLYDDVGSELFERITTLSAYYQTRAEIGILEQRAGEIIELARPARLVELGSGAGRKIRLLLDALGPAARGASCTLLDINARFLQRSIERLGADYPGCRFRGVVGDFVQDLDRLGPPGGRLLVLFAGTLGNLYPDQRRAFLRRLSAGMDASDAFLVGLDLEKDPARIEAAYNDPEGVTAAFNKNVLSAINRRFGADFRPGAFAHRAFYDRAHAWIEMRLVARERQRVSLRALGMTLDLAEGAEIRTEISCKLTRESLARDAAEADLAIAGWYTDRERLFALALLCRVVA
ncbi:hypothetical protein SOCEGT47_072670 [Sorangium cellulosum]|uniref:Histidine-specific methyltransferase SAM-dependent domain-containing protein n=1 Tax=Sorangium cellulosum TaxID=56 RepID=A0A4P2QAK6_SORCE|nr:hypothetical protein SOCEGT47_072670 [Sorangium cellulosum]